MREPEPLEQEDYDELVSGVKGAKKPDGIMNDDNIRLPNTPDKSEGRRINAMGQLDQKTVCHKVDIRSFPYSEEKVQKKFRHEGKNITIQEISNEYKSRVDKVGHFKGLHLLQVFISGDLALSIPFSNLKFHNQAGDYYLYNLVYSSHSKKVADKKFRQIVDYSRGAPVGFIQISGKEGVFKTQGGLSEMKRVHNCNKAMICLQFAFVDKIE